MMNILKHKIYIISYDENTLNTALSNFSNKTWAEVIKVDTDKYLENTMYDKWLLSKQESWQEYDYVGTLSWKSFTKIKIPELDSMDSVIKLKIYNPDVVTFYNCRCNLLDQAVSSHGIRFKHIWVFLLKELGFSEDQIFDPNIKVFFSNYWMCRPKVMIDYINFFHKVKNIIENTESIQNDLWVNSRYMNYVSTNRLVEIFGKPYFPLYIFVLERLPCFYFYHKYKVMEY